MTIVMKHYGIKVGGSLRDATPWPLSSLVQQGQIQPKEGSTMAQNPNQGTQKPGQGGREGGRESDPDRTNPNQQPGQGGRESDPDRTNPNQQPGQDRPGQGGQGGGRDT